MEIVELQTEAEFRAAFPLMHELRPHLTPDSFLEITGEMVWDGYRLFGGYEEGKLVALAGVAICLNLYHGRHLWVYDLVTTASARSRGHGRQMLEWLENLAREEKCERLALCSGVQRTDAHRFYEEKMRYERASYLYVKKL